MNVASTIALTAILVLTAAPAYAYIDPGTGGMLLQLVTGGVAGLLILARLYWKRVQGLFRSDGGSSRDQPSAKPTPADRQ